jgi:polysaccharide transporter, PST family
LDDLPMDPGSGPPPGGPGAAEPPPPGGVRARLAALLSLGSEGRTVGRNLGFLLGDRVVRLAVGLFVNAWLVRYLGPDRMGLMSFAQSLVLIAAVASQLGLETIMVRELVRRPAEERDLLGTALFLRLAGMLVTVGIALGAVSLMRPGDQESWRLTLVFTAIALAQVFDIVDYWFQSRAEVGPVVVARGVAFVVGSAAKIAVILMRAPLVVVAAVIAGEFALSAVTLLVAYALRGRSPLAWRWVPARGVALLRDSWPLVLNSVAIVISVRVDQMLLTTLRGPHENGLYAAAQRLTEVIYYVPVAVMAAANPILLRSHQRNRGEYERRLQRLFDLLARSGLGIALVLSLGAPWVVRFLFGGRFAATAPVLALLVWAAPLMFLGVAQTNWFVAENRQHGLMVRSAVAAVLSVLLNLWLVPRLGARGAARGLVGSQVVAQFALNALFPSTRRLFRMQCRAFLPLPGPRTEDAS